MSIDNIVKLIGKVNIAGDIDKEKLALIADDVIRRANEDDDSMKEWRESVDHGIQLCKPEFKSKDKPWAGAANYKSTILTEAANNFGNRATIEIMRDAKLVKASIIGLATIKNVIDKKASEIGRWKEEAERIAEGVKQLDPNDPQVQAMQKVLAELNQKIEENTQKIKEKKDELRKKSERADRIAELMNWQVNVKMEEWRRDQKRMMYSIPNVGTCIKKTYYDSTLGRSASKVINYPNFIVNQKTQCMKTCRSFTDIMAFTKAETDLRIAQGIWIDADLYADTDNLDAGGDEANKSATTSVNADKFYEQYCWLDLDSDGVEEPYIVTVHVGSAKVVRIVARYDEDSIIVKREDIKPMALLSAQKKRNALIDADNKEYGLSNPMPDPDDLTGYEIVRIEPIEILTKYGMIPSFDGSFLDVGFYHLIGSMTLGHNKTTNDLLNSGTLANTQGGIVAKNFRKKAGNFAVTPGEYIQTECSPDTLQSSIMNLPFKEPSPALYALNEKLENSARSFSANSDLGGQLQANTAPTTALAMIQESLIPHTAHMSMIIDSMSSEFNILYQLNRAHLDSDDYKKIVGDDEAVFAEDFDTDGMSVTCGANPESSSKTQRMMLAQAELEQVPMVMQAGGNAVPIVKNYYKQIGSQYVDEIFPNEAEMSPEDKAQMQQMQQMQQAQLEQTQQQSAMIQLQTELLKKGEERKDYEAQVAAKETLAKIDKMFEEIEEIKSRTILNYERAETEQVANQINTYTAYSDITAKNEELRMANEEIRNSQAEV
jgi:hypothetical protein